MQIIQLNASPRRLVAQFAGGFDDEAQPLLADLLLEEIDNGDELYDDDACFDDIELEFAD